MSFSMESMPDIKLHKYLDESGTFDYEKYRRIQEAGNKRKLHCVWVQEENISFLSDYIKQNIPEPSFGICHGTRRGMEQAWFRQYLDCDVIGTEISETANEFPHTMQWDFHDQNEEWVGKADFIYSNSFDHSYDPARCLKVWMKSLKQGGICILEHSSLHEAAVVNELDPFGAPLALMPFLVAIWGEGAFGVRQILTAPKKTENLDYLNFIVLQNF